MKMKSICVLILLAFLACYECKKKEKEIGHVENMTNKQLENSGFNAPIRKAIKHFNKKHGTRYAAVHIRRGFYTDKKGGSREYKLDIETRAGLNIPGVYDGFCEVQFVMKKDGRCTGAKVHKCNSYKKDPSTHE